MPSNHDETEVFEAPSRSQRRRDALALFDLGEALLTLPPSRLAGIDLPDDVRTEIAHVRRITAPVARKRQLQFLAKLMRRHDEDAFAAARAALGGDIVAHRRDVAVAHRLEALREQLLAEGDAALGELLQRHPLADRQNLRALIRQARVERAGNRPPHAYRELLRQLRALESAVAAATTDSTSEDATD
ncbi:MAG: DUF615 domain-containing protein [Pseudomonadota bacterium]|jgi:ribosome-associated protein|nr:DUF615 domain-containing protein [Pseudomonadota bacterium]MDE3141076.1 DUF615 domain-containing protein [Pseudomonadota bacterium]